MSGLVDALARLATPWGYIAVGGLAALEASAFVGLFVPGEVALLIGGYLAHEGRAELGVMMVVAALGAVAGDSLGYEVGRHLGSRLRTGRLGQRIGEHRWERAEDYLEAKGGRAIFFGRFIGVLRALVPALAGAARMPYRRFLAWNAAGGLIWAPGMVLLGYLAGSSFRRVERYAGRAGLLLLAVAASIAGVVVASRWVAGHHQQLRSWAAHQLERPAVARLRTRYRAQLDFVADRFHPGSAFGLSLTVQLGVLALGGWAFGSVVQDVTASDDLVRFDGPITRYVVEHRVDWLTSAMHGLTVLGSTTILVPLVVAAGVTFGIRRRSWAPAAFLAAAQLGSIVLYDTIKVLVGRPRPALGQLVATASGYSFPSGHATQVVAVWGALAILAIPALPGTGAKVAAGSSAAVIALLVGFSRIYLGVHWTTDVLGGWALGAMWLTGLVVTTRALNPP